jgi:hypothetical protein
MSNDGWIESNPTPSELQKKSKSLSRESHRRKKLSTHNTLSQASLSTTPSTSLHFPVSSTPACFSPPSPHHSTISPHMAPQAIPYFFSAYPAVATPVPYSAFMHFPAFPISMSMHGHTGLPLNGINMPYGTSPALVTRRAESIKPSLSTYRAKQSPLW